MPTSMTYDSLIEDLQRYLERGNVSDTEVYAQLPRLVNITERDIATKLKILGFLVPATDVMVAGTSVYTKPNRWRQTANFQIGIGATFDQYTPLLPRSYDYCRSYWPDPNVQAQPLYYADYDYNHWLVAPTPDQAYSMEVSYWELPALLDAVNQTNWLTDYAPNALLYGTLLQTAPFLKNDERVGVWQQYYNDQLSVLDGQDLQRILDRSTSRQEV